MGWKDKFQKHILERGYNYTYNVGNVKRKGNTVEACVSGTDDYMVKVDLDDYSMSCTCPYFERANCKHIAALLYCLENEEREDFKVSFESSDDIEELFGTVGVDEKLDFLLDLLLEDSKLSNRFRREFSDGIERQYYVERLSDILIEDDFDYKLSDFIDTDMEYLFNLGEYDLLITLLKSSTEAVLDEMRFDDYYFGSDFYTFEDILKKLTKSPVRNKVFEMISWQLTFYRDIYGMDSLIDFYAETFTQKEELEEKLDVIEEILDKSSVYKEKFVLMKIDTMKSLSLSMDEINEFRDKYSSLKEIRQQYIDEAVENEDYDLAIKLIKKELNKDIGFIFKTDYENQLKELYLKVNDNDNYKKLLEDIIFDGIPDIDHYIEYKKLFTNWDEEREEFFKKIDDYRFLNECYKQEELYDRLVLNLKDEYDLGEYRDILKDKCPCELLDAYLNIVNNLVSNSGTRKHYRNIAELLKEMQNIDGGEIIVNRLVEDWKVRYKRRTAMLEELEVLK